MLPCAHSLHAFLSRRPAYLAGALQSHVLREGWSSNMLFGNPGAGNSGHVWFCWLYQSNKRRRAGFIGVMMGSWGSFNFLIWYRDMNNIDPTWPDWLHMTTFDSSWTKFSPVHVWIRNKTSTKKTKYDLYILPKCLNNLFIPIIVLLMSDILCTLPNNTSCHNIEVCNYVIFSIINFFYKHTIKSLKG